MLQSCLQLKCDIEDIVDQLEREKWVLEWKKRKDGGKDIANVITGNLPYYHIPILHCLYHSECNIILRSEWPISIKVVLEILNVKGCL